MNQPIQVLTDQQYTVNLDSTIVYATWKVLRAYGGSTAEVEVRTAYVGDGASIQIRLEGEESGELGGVDDTICGNRYIADIPIPDSVKVDEKVWFSAKLPKHGIDATSAKIPAAIAIECVKIEWGQQVARRGDVIDLKAEFLGLRDTAPCNVLILEYDRDENHDLITTIPTEIKEGKLTMKWEYEYHEDTDEIPTEEELQEYGSHYNPPEYFFVVEIDGQRFGEEQESGLLEFKDWIEINLVDESDRDLSNQECVIHLPDGNHVKNVLNRDGYVKVEDVPPGVIKIDLETCKK